MWMLKHYGKLYDCYNTEKEAEEGLKSDPLMVDGFDVTEETIIEEGIPNCKDCHNYGKNDGGCPGLEVMG